MMQKNAETAVSSLFRILSCMRSSVTARAFLWILNLVARIKIKGTNGVKYLPWIPNILRDSTGVELSIMAGVMTRASTIDRIINLFELTVNLVSSFSKTRYASINTRRAAMI